LASSWTPQAIYLPRRSHLTSHHASCFLSESLQVAPPLFSPSFAVPMPAANHQPTLHCGVQIRSTTLANPFAQYRVLFRHRMHLISLVDLRSAALEHSYTTFVIYLHQLSGLLAAWVQGSETLHDFNHAVLGCVRLLQDPARSGMGGCCPDCLPA
jgi:hypothetical protein